MHYIYALDLLGVFVFSVYGSHKAIAARFDILGVLVCGFITAVGGGTIREVMLHGTPAYFHDYTYAAAIALGTFFAVCVHRRFSSWERPVAALDAIGLATFAYIGAYRADMAHLGIGAMLFFAIVTAAGGGAMSDIISGKRPEMFYKDFYPLAAIVVAVGYYVTGSAARHTIPALILITLGFMVRLGSMHLRLVLWKPYRTLRIKPLPKRRLQLETEKI